MKANVLELSRQQWQALDASALPPRSVDPQTQKAYVVIAADLFERMQRVFEEVDPSLYEFEEIDPQ